MILAVVSTAAVVSQVDATTVAPTVSISSVTVTTSHTTTSTAAGNDFCVPVIDLSRPEIIRHMEGMGITSFIPIGNFMNATFGNGSSGNRMGIPIISSSAAARLNNQQPGSHPNGTVGLFPHIGGIINLGQPWTRDPPPT